MNRTFSRPAPWQRSGSASERDVIRVLRKARAVWIVSHDGPDGDALGSVAGLRRALAAAGVPVAVAGFPSIGRRYRACFAAGEMDPPAGGPLPETDTAVVLDCSDPERPPPHARAFRAFRTVVNVDHHADNTRFGDINWVDPAASSTGELVWRILVGMRCPIPAEAADMLWMALYTDTGRFAYSNVTPDCLAIAADLVRRGAQPAETHRRLYGSATPGELDLRRRALDSLRTTAGGRVAWVTLDRADFRDCGCVREDAEDIVNLPRDLAGVRLAFFFYRFNPGPGVHVSARSQSDRDDVARLCRRFGGGGHPRAAGCTLEGRLADVRRRVLAAARGMLAGLDPRTPVP